MLKIIIYKNDCFNINEEELEDYINKGAVVLTDEQIDEYGIRGYESEVSPETAKVNEDGSVTFTPSYTNLIEEELFCNLRLIRDAKLEMTDKYLISDFPISDELLSKIKVYRKELRDLTILDGAPWDGGGRNTPWPINPLN